MIRVLPITSWATPCGIAEFAGMLRTELQQTSRGAYLLEPDPRHLDPTVFAAERHQYEFDVLWMNYHAALHARWTPELIQRLRDDGIPVVITYHDTGVPNSQQCLDLYGCGTPFIVHEPCDDLPGALYLRQGVPPWHPAPAVYRGVGEGRSADWRVWLGGQNRPIVGTVGFPFPWKNYDLLCRGAALAGWSVLLIAPDVYGGHKPDELAHQIERWRALNPWTAVVSDFPDSPQVVSMLSACDATAFLYTCCNTGTSGAIRQGIAARKPVIATTSCRQFRDLYLDPVGHAAISWIDVVDFGQPEQVADALAKVPIGRVYPPMVRLAEQDSWARVADRYAAVFRGGGGRRRDTMIGDNAAILPVPAPGTQASRLALNKFMDALRDAPALAGVRAEGDACQVTAGQAEARWWEYAMALYAIRQWQLPGGPLATPDLAILDAGGAGSRFVHLLDQQTTQGVCVVDPGASMDLAIYPPGTQILRCTLEQAAGTPQIVEPGSIAILTAISVIEHLGCVTPFLRAAHRLLQPGGLFFLTTDAWGCDGPDTAHFHWMRERLYNPTTLEKLRQTLREVGFRTFGGSDQHYPGDQLYGSYTFHSICVTKK